MSLEKVQWQARVDLAACHRLAVHFAYNEGIDNHFTLLVPGHNDRFFLAPFGLHWSEIRAGDFLIVDFTGNVLSGIGLVEDTAHIARLVRMLAMPMMPIWSCIDLLFVYEIFLGLSSPAYFVIPQILGGPRAAARWVGVQNMVGNFPGLNAPASGARDPLQRRAGLRVRLRM